MTLLERYEEMREQGRQEEREKTEAARKEAAEAKAEAAKAKAVLDKARELTVKAIKRIMLTQNMSAEEALNEFEIPSDERAYYLEKLS